MATGETGKTTKAVPVKPLYLVPKFTSERWGEGVYDAELNKISHSMSIREEDLLTFHERVEVETRSLIFQYQLMYAEKEYELLKKEFQNIEAKLNQREVSDAESAEHDFVKPVIPVDKESRKNAKTRTTSKSGSETDEKGASADETAASDDKSIKKTGRTKKNQESKKSGSETDKELTSSQEGTEELGDDGKSIKKTGRPKRNQGSKKSGSETDKELTSSQEGTDEPRRSERKSKKK